MTDKVFRFWDLPPDTEPPTASTPRVPESSPCLLRAQLITLARQSAAGESVPLPPHIQVCRTCEGHFQRYLRAAARVRAEPVAIVHASDHPSIRRLTRS